MKQLMASTLASVQQEQRALQQAFCDAAVTEVSEQFNAAAKQWLVTFDIHL